MNHLLEKINEILGKERFFNPSTARNRMAEKIARAVGTNSTVFELGDYVQLTRRIKNRWVDFQLENLPIGKVAKIQKMAASDQYYQIVFDKGNPISCFAHELTKLSPEQVMQYLLEQ